MVTFSSVPGIVCMATVGRATIFLRTNWLGLHGSGRHSDSDSVGLDNFKMKQRFFHAGKVKLPVFLTDQDNET